MKGPCSRGDHGYDTFVLFFDPATQEPCSWYCHSCPAKGSVRDGWLLEVGEQSPAVDKASPPRLRPLPVPRPRPQATHFGEIPEYHAEVLSVALQAYAECFSDPNSRGREFLVRRNLSLDGIELTSPIGYAPGGEFLLRTGVDARVLFDLGLILESGDDRFVDRIVLPFTWNGRVNCLHGRRVDMTTTNKHLYTNTHGTIGTGVSRWKRGVFNEDALDQPLVVLGEGALDALGLMLDGMRNAVGLGGAFHELTAARLADTGARVLAALDNDQAGDDGSALFKERLPGKVRRILPPGWEDGVKDWAEARERALRRPEHGFGAGSTDARMPIAAPVGEALKLSHRVPMGDSILKQ